MGPGGIQLDACTRHSQPSFCIFVVVFTLFLVIHKKKGSKGLKERTVAQEATLSVLTFR